MTAEGPCRPDPFVVVLNGSASRRPIRVAEVSLTIAHDEEAPHAVVLGAGFHLLQVSLVGGFIEEEHVHVLDGVEPVVFSRGPGEIEVVHLAVEERAVERPLGERDSIEGFSLGSREYEPGEDGEEPTAVHGPGIV